MRFLSVCSGIEAASCAWGPLGWEAAAFAEIDPFPSAVLAHHYPQVPNIGDFTRIEAKHVGSIDVLVGGTPCQSFSVAGLRGGLDDERGNLALEFLRLADRARPEWLVWENVPGVLSSNGGRDFGAILGGMVELGYGFAYRVLDAQHFGVPQRRRRVFVVGYLGDWRPAAAVLFERHCMQGHPPPRREPGKGTAPTLSARTKGGGGLGTDFDLDGGLVAPLNDVDGVSHAVAAARGSSKALDATMETYVAHALANHHNRQDATVETFIPVVSGTLGNNGKAAGTATTQDAFGSQLVAFTAKDHGADASDDGLAPTLRGMAHDKSHANGGGQVAVATSICLGSDPLYGHDVAMPQTGRNGDPGVVQMGAMVRRLTPRECERLQGFRDDYTLVPYRGGLAADGPRYKALGNSMAVPCMRWIGERIALVANGGPACGVAAVV